MLPDWTGFIFAALVIVAMFALWTTMRRRGSSDDGLS
jgi:hypothetical protein